jgi:hypothetical protein
MFNAFTVLDAPIQNNIGLPFKNFLVSHTLSCVDVTKRTITVRPFELVIDGIHAISTIALAFCDKTISDKTPFKSNLIRIELFTPAPDEL